MRGGFRRRAPRNPPVIYFVSEKIIAESFFIILSICVF